MSEFTRMIDLRSLGNAPVVLTATPEECAALARRFDIPAVHSLTATAELVPEGPVIAATGRIKAEIVQSCAVSGEDIAVSIDEPLQLRFVPEARYKPDEEIELAAEELDEIPYTGTAFDLGEAAAQSLALAIDPFLTGPQAEAARAAAGLLDESSGGAFAALAALKLPPN